MSSIEKEFDTREKKGSKLKLTLKLPSLRSRSASSPLERSASTGSDFPNRNLRRIKEEDDKGEASSDSDDSYDSEEEMKKYQQQGGRRRSLSTSNMDDIRSDDSEDETDDTKPRSGSLSRSRSDAGKYNKPRPDSPTVPALLSPKSCLRHNVRRRSTSMSDVEEILNNAHNLHVHFSPDTVDPPERNCKYREYCERKLGLKGLTAPNLKHEIHKQHMVSFVLLCLC